MRIIYKNSQGRRLNLNNNNIKFGGGDVFDYEWKPVINERQYGGTIRQFNKEAKTLTFSVFLSGSDDERKTVLNEIYEACEYDVFMQKNGKLYFMPDGTNAPSNENYYVNCYLIEANVESGVTIGADTPVVLKFYCYDGFWFREAPLIYFGSGGGAAEGDFLDYPIGYNYDYSRQLSASAVSNTNFVDTDFKITIHGPAVNPVVYIDGHGYGIEYTLVSDNQYIVINSTDKTIKLNNNGKTTNIFDYRDRDSYIFDLIAPGENSVTWNGSFSWEIRLIEKRSAPKWI